MRPRIVPGGWRERLALWANLAPAPVADALLGMAMARTAMAGAELGLFAALADGALTADEVASRCHLDPTGAHHLLDCLAAVGYVRRRTGRYCLDRRARKWLDPRSPTSIAGVLAFNYLQWDWWAGMERAVRGGPAADIHSWPPDDPRWDRYVGGMFELARLSAPEVARRLRLSPHPRRLLDLGGAHGWFAAELCRRHPGLQATVMDLPGSVRAGRRIIAREGLDDRVQHVEGNALADPLGGPWDAVLCFQLIHHVTPEQNAELFRRIAAALNPGGTVAVLDYFAPPVDRPPDTSALLGLHFHLTSASTTHRADQLGVWLAASGFSDPRRIPVRSIPIQTLYQARLLARP